MKISLDIPNPGEEIITAWESGFKISTKVADLGKEGLSIVLSMNNAGLISLAKFLLILAQPEVPAWNHYHFDDYNDLEPGSVGLVIEKIPE